MERKDGVKNEETMRIRMSADLLRRIQDLKVPCGWGEEADSSFARHLIIVGLGEEEQIIREREIRNEGRDKRAASPDFSEFIGNQGAGLNHDNLLDGSQKR